MLAPCGGLGHIAAHIHIVAQILHVPIERRLVGKHIDVIMMDVHAVRHLLDNDAALGIADQPVQERLGALGIVRRYKCDVCQRLFDLINRIEITRDP